MANANRAPKVLLATLGASAGTLLVLNSAGALPDFSSLRGGRRLQMTHGVLYGDEMRQGMTEYGGHLHNGMQQAGGHMANLGGHMANGVSDLHGGVRDAAGDLHSGVRGAVGDLHQGWHQGAQDLHQGWHQGAQYTGQALNQGAYHAGRFVDHVSKNPIESIFDSMKYNPHHWLDNFFGSAFQFCLLGAQAVFAVLYFCMVVSKYPYWNGPTPMSCQLQAEPAPLATTQTSPSNCCLSYLCPQARAAHTFDKTGVMDYWCGVLAMFFCPFCTLCWANACTDLNPKLGGEPSNIIQSLFCTWCCSCCVIAQDAESLDAATGVQTQPCGVTGGGMPVPYGGMGPGMMPGQMMMGGPGMYPRY